MRRDTLAVIVALALFSTSCVGELIDRKIEASLEGYAPIESVTTVKSEFNKLKKSIAAEKAAISKELALLAEDLDGLSTYLSEVGARSDQNRVTDEKIKAVLERVRKALTLTQEIEAFE